MEINGFSPVSAALPSTGMQKTNTAYESQQKFANFLEDSLNNVMKAEAESNALTTRAINGENVDIHQVMAAAQRSGITVQLTLEVRNKAIEAYQEMMRIQM